LGGSFAGWSLSLLPVEFLDQLDCRKSEPLNFKFQLSWGRARCGGTSTGNGLVQLEIGSYNQLAWYERLIPAAHATVSSVTFCFKRVRFKANSVDSADPANDASNVDFEIGQVTLSPSGTTLGSVSIPKGTYSRVEFDLEDNCGTATSVQVSNSNTGGPFTSGSRITIKFEGTFIADEASERLQLGVQAMINALNTVTASGSQVKTSLEAASGSM